MSQTADVIVIGVGGVGSAVLFHLAQRGVQALGLEQFTPGHDHGSSHGESRMIRTAYFEHPDYVPLAQKAFRLWEKLEQDSGEDLLRRTGLFVAGTPDSEAVQGTLNAARQHGLTVETFDSHEASRRFEGFRFHEEEIAVFENDAGVLKVEKAVQTHVRLAEQQGAELRTNEPVYRWSVNGQTVTVETERNRYECQTLILTVGPWMGNMLRGLPVECQVLRKVQLWGEAMPGAYRKAPAYYFDRPGGAFYGFPADQAGLVKLAQHSGGEPVEDPALLRRTIDDEDVQPAAAFVNSTLTNLQTFPVRASACMYTMSPDGHFLVGRHPNHKPVLFAAGLSGHGFKFAGILGQALSELAIDGKTELPIGFLDVARFNN